MTDETPELPEGADESDAIALSGEQLWKIGTGEEPCEDEGLFRSARDYCALMMRQNGHGYQEIAAQLGCAVGTAWNGVQRILKKTLREPADQIRGLHLQRLEAMLVGFMDRATEGDTFAAATAIQIMGKIEALMGVKPPEKVEVSFGDQTNDARAALFKAISALNPERDAAPSPPKPAPKRNRRPKV